LGWGGIFSWGKTMRKGDFNGNRGGLKKGGNSVGKEGGGGGWELSLNQRVNCLERWKTFPFCDENSFDKKTLEVSWEVQRWGLRVCACFIWTEK